METQKTLKFNCGIHSYGTSGGSVHNKLEDLSDQLSDFEYTLLDNNGTNTYKYKIELVLTDNSLVSQIRDMYQFHTETGAGSNISENALPSFPKLLIQWGYEDAMSKVHIAQISDFKYKFKDNKEKVIQIECVDLPSFAEEFMTRDTISIKPFGEDTIALIGDPDIVLMDEFIEDPWTSEDFLPFVDWNKSGGTQRLHQRFFKGIPVPYVRSGGRIKRFNFVELYLKIFQGIGEQTSDVATLLPELDNPKVLERIEAINQAYLTEYLKVFTRIWTDIEKTKTTLKLTGDTELEKSIIAGGLASLVGAGTPGIDAQGNLQFTSSMVYGVAAGAFKQFLKTYFGITTVLNSKESRYAKKVFFDAQLHKQDFGVHGNFAIPLEGKQIQALAAPVTQDATVTTLDDIVENKIVTLFTDASGDLRVNGNMKSGTSEYNQFRDLRVRVVLTGQTEFENASEIMIFYDAEVENYDISKFKNRRDITQGKTVENPDIFGELDGDFPFIHPQRTTEFNDLPDITSVTVGGYRGTREDGTTYWSTTSEGNEEVIFEVDLKGITGAKMAVREDTQYFDPAQSKFGTVGDLIKELDVVELKAQEPAQSIIPHATDASGDPTPGSVDLGTGTVFNDLKYYQKMLVRYSNIRIRYDVNEGENFFKKLESLKNTHNKYFANPHDHMDFKMYNYRTTDALANRTFKDNKIHGTSTFFDVSSAITDKSDFTTPKCWVVELNIGNLNTFYHALPEVKSFQLQSIEDQIIAQGSDEKAREKLKLQKPITLTYGKSGPLTPSATDSIVKFFEFNGDLRVLANLVPDVRDVGGIQRLTEDAKTDNLVNHLIPILKSIMNNVKYKDYITERYGDSIAVNIFSQLSKLQALLLPLNPAQAKFFKPVELDAQWFSDMNLIEDTITNMETPKDDESAERFETFLKLLSLITNRVIFNNLFESTTYREGLNPGEEPRTEISHEKGDKKELGNTEKYRPPEVSRYKLRNTNIFDTLDFTGAQLQSNAERAIISDYVNQYNTAWEVKIKTLGIPELDGIEEIIVPRIVRLEVRDLSREALNDAPAVHWLSGNYRILGLKHNLNPKGYTSELTLLKNIL